MLQLGRQKLHGHWETRGGEDLLVDSLQDSLRGHVLGHALAQNTEEVSLLDVLFAIECCHEVDCTTKDQWRRRHAPRTMHGGRLPCDRRLESRWIPPFPVTCSARWMPSTPPGNVNRR